MIDVAEEATYERSILDSYGVQAFLKGHETMELIEAGLLTASMKKELEGEADITVHISCH